MSKQVFAIKRLDTYETIVSYEASTLKEALEKLVSGGQILYRADLFEADLSEANLSEANLSGADLSGADLSGADLFEADLSEANLSEANLSGADLSGAKLSEADLSGADLSGADLSGADLSGAKLSGANLDFFKNDLWVVLLHVPHEISGLAAALRQGGVNGFIYEGECACLLGTIANVRGCTYKTIPGLKPDTSRPAERWFMSIAKGNTPENSTVVKLTLSWIEEFQALTVDSRVNK